MATSAWKLISDFVRQARQAETPRALCLYASDAEIFDFRPGRFRTEEKLSDDQRMGAAGAGASRRGGGRGNDRAFERAVADERAGAGQRLSLESAACPVPVKKQRKYNLARWAVTGRDNLAINAACQRIYEGMLDREHRPGEVGNATLAHVRRRATQKKTGKSFAISGPAIFAPI